MPNQEWVLEVRIDDSNVNEQAKKITERLKGISLVSFDSAIKNIDSIVAGLSKLTTFAMASSDAFAGLKQSMSGLGNVNLAAPATAPISMPVMPGMTTVVKARIATSDVKTGIRNLAVEASKQIKELERYFDIEPKVYVDIDRQKIEGDIKEFAAGLGKDFGKMFGTNSIDSVGKSLNAMFKLIESKKDQMKASRFPEETAKQFERAINESVPKIIESIGKLNLSKFIEDGLTKKIDLSYLEKLIAASCKSGFLKADYADVFNNVRIAMASGAKKGVEQGQKSVTFDEFERKIAQSSLKGEIQGFKKGIETANLSALVAKIQKPIEQGVAASKQSITDTVVSAVKDPRIAAAFDASFGATLKNHIDNALNSSKGVSELKSNLFKVIDETKVKFAEVGLNTKKLSSLKGAITKNVNDGLNESQIAELFLGKFKNIVAPVGISFPSKSEIETILDKIQPNLPVKINITAAEKERVEKVLSEFMGKGVEPQRFKDLVVTIESLINNKGKFLSTGGTTFADALSAKLAIVEQQIARINSATSQYAELDNTIKSALQNGITKDSSGKVAIATEGGIAAHTSDIVKLVDQYFDTVKTVVTKKAVDTFYDLRSKNIAGPALRDFIVKSINSTPIEEIRTIQYWDKLAKAISDGFVDAEGKGIKIAKEALKRKIYDMFMNDPTFAAEIDIKFNGKSVENIEAKIKEVKKVADQPITIVAVTKTAQERLDDLIVALRKLNGVSTTDQQKKYAIEWNHIIRELNGAGAVIDGVERSAAGLNNVFGRIFKAQTGVTVKSISDSMKGLGGEFDKTQAHIVSTTNILKNFITKANAVKAVKLGVSLATWGTGFGGLDVAINHVITSLTGVGKSASNLNNLKSGLTGAAGAANAAAGSVNRIRTKPFQNIAGALKTGLDQTAASAKKLALLMESLGNTFSQFSMSGMGLMFMGQAITQYISGLLQNANSVDKEVAATATILGNTRDEIVDYYDTVYLSLNKMTGTLPVARENIAKALHSISALGREGKDLETITTVSAMGARAMGGDDAATVAKIVDSALNVYGLGIEKAMHVTDLFAYISNKTKLGIEDLAATFNQAVGTVATFGMPIEDLTEFITIASKAGTSAETIGSSLKSTMLRIAKGDTKFGLTQFIKDQGLGLPKGIAGLEEYQQKFQEVTNKIKLIKERQIAIQASTMDNKSKTAAMSALNSQLTTENAKIKLLGQQYGDLGGQATKSFNEIIAAVYKAKQEGKLTDAQIAGMFETTDVQAMLSYGKYVAEHKDEVATIKEEIKAVDGLSKAKSEGYMATPTGQEEKIRAKISELNEYIYKAIRDQYIKLASVALQYFPHIKELIDVLAVELGKLGDIAASILGPFLKWFSSLDAGVKSMIMSKALLFAIAAIVGGPLMVYIGAVGSAFNGFAKSILGVSRVSGEFIDKLFDMFATFMLGSQAGCVPLATTTLGKFKFALDLAKRSVTGGIGGSPFFQTIFDAANAKNFIDFKSVYLNGLSNMHSGTKNNLTSISGLFTGFGSGIKGLGTRIVGIFSGLNLTSILGGVKSALQGVAMAIPLVTTGIVSMTIAALPYIAIIIAIIGALYLLYTAWTQNWGGIQQIVANATTGIMDGLGKLYDFIMTIISPIVQVIDTIGKAFVDIFLAIQKGDWSGIMKVANDLANNLSDIIINAFYAIGGAIYDTLSGFFNNTGNFIDSGGLESIGWAIVSFLGALVVTIGTVLVTVFSRVYTFLYASAFKLSIRFFGALGSLLFDLFIDTIAFVVNNVLIALPRFANLLFNGFLQALPLPDVVKKQLAQNFEFSDGVLESIQNSVTGIATGLKSKKNEVAKGLSDWFDAVAPIDDRSEEQRKRGQNEGESYKKGVKKGIEGSLTGVTSGLQGIAGMGQINPLSAAEQSSANISENLTKGILTFKEFAESQQKVEAGRMSTIQEYVKLKNQRDEAFASGKNTTGLDVTLASLNTKIDSYGMKYNDLAVAMLNADRYNAANPVGYEQQVASNFGAVDVPYSGVTPYNVNPTATYTLPAVLPPVTSGIGQQVNIENVNVNSVKEAEEFISNPLATGVPPMIDMGINVSI